MRPGVFFQWQNLRMVLILPLVVATLLLPAALPADEVTETLPADAHGSLLYFSSEHCGYCRRFERDVGDAYHRTDIGQRFPMQKIMVPDEETNQHIARKIYFTPTFIIVDRQAVEQKRIRGYINSELFWTNMHQALAEMGLDPEKM